MKSQNLQCLLRPCREVVLVFNENSVIVKTWVELVRNGTYQKESVPNISNLQEIVFEILKMEVE